MSAAEGWLARSAARAPDAEAIVFEGERLTYRALAARADVLADALADLGIGPGARVAVLLGNGLAFALLFHALRIRRAVLLPLNTRCTSAELGDQLRDAGADWLVHGEGDFERQAVACVAEAGCPGRARIDEAGCVRALSAPERPARGPSVDAADARLLTDAALILYTSGTTGRPKGAVLGVESLVASADASAALLGASSRDRWLLCMPLFHVGGLSILVRACLSDAAVVIHRRFDPALVATALEAEAISAVSWVASMLDRVLAARGGRRAPATLRLALLGGGPAPAALLHHARAQGFPVAPTYGLTEAASQVATRLPGDTAEPLDARLVPLPGIALRITDEQGRALAPGEVGEIEVCGPTLMRGYLGRPDANARALRDGWLHTGDLGCLDAEGRLRVLDRRDDLIVSGGENVYPAEIEAVLHAHPRVAEAGVVGVPDTRFGSRPVAWWVASEPDADAPDLAAYCRERLAAYKVPVAFHRVDALPRTASGKLQRRNLRELG